MPPPTIAENTTQIPRPKLSLAFQRFRQKHSKLSTMHWTHVVGVEAIKKAIVGMEPSAVVVKELGINVRVEDFGFDVATANEWSEDYLNRCRLHVLAICAANLEAFLKDAAKAYVASLGYSERPGQLTRPGEAIGKPIINKSTIPEMLDYAEHLFHADYASNKDRWKDAYKLRCMLVHTGGWTDRRPAKKAGGGKSSLHHHSEYSWKELKSDLQAAFEIAQRTNAVLGKATVRVHEFGFELRQLKEFGALPEKKDVWHHFHSLGLSLPGKRERRTIEAEFYR
jgi:hypothetical protein